MITVSRAASALHRAPNRCSVINLSFAPAKAPKESQARPKVLVINDESNVCELLQLYLEPQGLEVATVRTAEEARTLIARGQFDLIILDWELDGGLGLALLSLSKAAHPEIPVIMFTGGDPSDAFIEDGPTREADAVVRRKGSLAALSATIFRHLELPDAEAHDRVWRPKNSKRR